jgi:hypothetical protein
MAKTTGKISGNHVLVSIGGTTVSCTTSATFTGTTERTEDTCKDDDGAKTYSPGSIDGEINCEGIVKFDTPANFKLVVEAWINKTIGDFQMGGLTNDDDPYIEFEGFISNLTWTGPLNNPSTFSFQAVPTGPIRLFNS